MLTLLLALILWVLCSQLYISIAFYLHFVRKTWKFGVKVDAHCTYCAYVQTLEWRVETHLGASLVRMLVSLPNKTITIKWCMRLYEICNGTAKTTIKKVPHTSLSFESIESILGIEKRQHIRTMNKQAAFCNVHTWLWFQKEWNKKKTPKSIIRSLHT